MHYDLRCQLFIIAFASCPSSAECRRCRGVQRRLSRPRAILSCSKRTHQSQHAQHNQAATPMQYLLSMSGFCIVCLGFLRSVGTPTPPLVSLYLSSISLSLSLYLSIYIFKGYRLCRRPLRLELLRTGCLELRVALDGDL